MSAKDLGGLLRITRELRNRSLHSVARADGGAGISPAYLQKLERGQVAKPSPHILHRLSETLEVPYSDLMQLAGYLVSSASGDPAVNVLAHAMKSKDLTKEEVRALAEYLAWYRHSRGEK